MIDFFFWLTPWERLWWAPPLFLAAAVVYARGAGERPPGAWRQGLFWAGLALMWFGLQSGLDYFSEHAFFVHRLQHLILHHVAPMLIALAVPLQTMGWTPPRFVRALNHPVVAPVLFSALIIFWLIPPVHVAAMLDARLYAIMNVSIALNGVMFWASVLNASRRPLTRMLMALAVAPTQIALGLLLMSANSDLYPVYALCGRATGLDALTDQRLGGLILWLPGVMMSLLAVLIVLLRLLCGAASPTAARRESSDGSPEPCPR
ncbi:MAG: cytochrome c oxidase assembly protein [Asticcacaulis sp.]|uniref:cytochrome c oxidase assembly protein n=1 Tax=Asticcacaulis sp. TaxID=1872648 RepID=UPI003F7CB1DC